MKQRPEKKDVHCLDWGLRVANGTVFLFSLYAFEEDQEL